MPTRTPPANILAAAPGLWSQAGQAHWLPVQGQSMQPFLRPGDEVWVVPGLTGARRGDVVVLATPAGLLVHRLLRAEPWSQPQCLWTQGDSNRRPDAAAGVASCLGRVLAVRRQGATLAVDTSRWRASNGLIALGLLAVNHLDHLNGPSAPIGRLAAGAGWRLLRAFCRLACR